LGEGAPEIAITLFNTILQKGRVALCEAIFCRAA
jgi:hypothetical protein